MGRKLGDFAVTKDRRHKGFYLKRAPGVQIVPEPVQPLAIKTQIVPGKKSGNNPEQPPAGSFVK